MISFITNRVPSANIAWQMSRRAVAQRYRGSLLGVAWAFLTPLFMLVVYTFIFTKVFAVRWGQEVTDGSVGGLGVFEFAVVLFAGLSLYSFLSEVTLGASTAITDNVNYVKKVVFPLRVLPIVTLISALFQLLISLLILVVFQLIVTKGLPWTALLAPLTIAPLVLLLAGLAWWFAALGTYLRDINQVLAPLVTALLFLGPILYPIESFAPEVRPWLVLSPLTVPIEAFRDVLIWGELPNWTHLGVYTLVAIVITVLGWIVFSRTRAGFADVL